MFSVIEKGHDVISVEDLDNLQTEIESSLVSVMQRKWQLESDLQILTDNSAQSTDANLDINNPSHQQTDGNANTNLRKSNNLSSASSINYSSASSICSISSDNSIESSLHSGTTNTTSTTAWTESSTVASTHSLSSKRNSRIDEKPSKRFKLESSNSYSRRPSHSKHRSKVVPHSNDETTETISKLAFRNDTPDKFWPFVAQFCAAPTATEIEALENMLKAYEEDKDYFRIPNLGRKGQVNNKSNDQKGSPSKSDSTSKKSNSLCTGSITSPKTLNKSRKGTKVDTNDSNALGVETSNKKSPSKSVANRKSNADEEACLGALTQRLVSCLMEENSYTFEEMEAELGIDTNATGNNKKNHRFRNLDLGQDAKLLEKKIRTTLEEHHILTEQDDISFGSEDDDVLRELRCCQNELSLIQTYNKEAIVSLIARAKRRSDLDEMREKLAIANADVVDSYQRLILAKQKKRNPTKKEKESAWKAIQEQEVIFHNCEELSIN